MKQYDIISAGLMVYDIIVSPVGPVVFEQDSTRLENIAFATGGDALNVAVDAAKLGMNVVLGGVVGNDMPGRFLLEEAQKHGVNTSGVSVSEKNQSSVSVVLCREGGQRHFAYYGKANDEFDGKKINDELLSQSKLLYIGSMMALKSLEYQGLSDLFRRAKGLGVITAMDSTWANDGIWLPKIEEALTYTDIFIPSIYEAEQLTGTKKPEEIVEFLHKCGVKIAGVKLGKDGVFVEDFYMPAFECENVVDTTGAGDAFMSGFISGYVKGLSIYDCALLGSALSNCCIRAIGATTGACTFEEAQRVIEMSKNGTLK